MKRKKHFKPFITLLLMLLFFVSCEEDLHQDAKTNQQPQNIRVERFLGTASKNMTKKLVEKTASLQKFNHDFQEGSFLRTSNLGTINDDEILLVIDSLGIENYTFLIDNHPEEDDQTFFNLVVNVDLQEQSKVFFVKYEMEASFAADFALGLQTFETFRGTISSERVDLSVPCPEFIQQIVGVGGGSVNGGNNTNPPGSGSANNPGSGNQSGSGNTWGGSSPGGGNSGAVFEAPLNGEPCEITQEKYDACIALGGTGMSVDAGNCICHLSPRNFRIGVVDIVAHVGVPNGLDGNDPCNPVDMTIAVIKPQTKGCERLNKIAAYQPFVTNMQVLKNNVLNGTVEKMFWLFNADSNMQPQDPFIDNNPIITGFQNGLNSGTIYNGTIGFGHNHLGNPIYKHLGIFSISDLSTMHTIASRGLTQPAPIVPVESVVMFLVSHHGNYALRITDMQKFTANFDNKIQYTQDINGNNILDLSHIHTRFFYIYYEEYINFQMNKKNQEIGFLKFLKTYGLDDALELYESPDDTFQSWNLLKLNSSETDVKPIPCKKSQK